MLKEIDLSNIFSQIEGVSWEKSNKYLPDTSILKTIDFAGITDTDIYVESSFAASGKLPLKGGVIRTFTNDNLENEHFIFYCLSLQNMMTKDLLTIELQPKGWMYFMTIKNFLRTFPFISLILFNLVIMIFPKVVREIFTYINLLAVLFVGTFYFWIVLKTAYRLLKAKEFTIGGQTVTYVLPQDTYFLKPEQMIILKNHSISNCSKSGLKISSGRE